MESMNVILLFACFGTLFLSISWIKLYGFRKGALISLLRLIWIFPIVLSFFPRRDIFQVPTAISLQNIRMFIDDSSSMKRTGWKDHAENLYDKFSEECLRIGCRIEKKYLSDYSASTVEGLSLLGKALESWSYEVNQDPWIIASDGGKSLPQKSWPLVLDRLKNSKTKSKSGLILAYEDNSQPNIWLKAESQTIFSFENKPIVVPVEVFRNQFSSNLSVQVQVSSGDKYLATTNLSFAAGDSTLSVKVPIPALSRGHHLIEIKLIPTANESILWDNTVYRNIEVMPNTIGILHLLGAPSWDGRFVRRYLKSEPKYDLISFFILRDPTDQQLTNERELSLIPFPVDRLFKQELPNFRSVVIQNFSLFQFLEPSYQENLVKFVKAGGGLLFVGGPRALHASDYMSSALADILPFEVDSKKSISARTPLLGLTSRDRSLDRAGPFYDPDLEFTIKLSEPDHKSRELANVYDDWSDIVKSIEAAGPLKGLHHMEHVKFKDGEYTPLLTAKSSDGVDRHLAVASYPGKGRALWIFSDSLWKSAMNPKVPRDVYQTFLDSSMTWLLRQELRQPLRLNELAMEFEHGKLFFEVSAHGIASSYLSDLSHWKISLCGFNLDHSQFEVQSLGTNIWRIKGSLSQIQKPKNTCYLKLWGEHPSFGSVRAGIGGNLPVTYSDDRIPFSRTLIDDLASIADAKVLTESHFKGGMSWLSKRLSNSGIASPVEERSKVDYYWVWRLWWVYVLLLAMPAEVVLRRWVN